LPAAVYQALMTVWITSRLAMYFWADLTTRLRGENPKITLEQVADAANNLCS
jgi:hypothetical protein